MYYKALIVIGVLFGLLVNLSFAMGTAPSTHEARDKAIDFKLEDLNGNSHALSDYKGKIVFLNFWATWCPPCRKEMPSMQKLYGSWDKRKYAMVAVNIGETKDKVKDFTDKNGYTFTVLLDPDKSVSKKYMVRGIPTTYFVDEKGYIITKIVGTREWTMEGIRDLIK